MSDYCVGEKVIYEYNSLKKAVSFRKRPKRIKGGVVNVVNKEIPRTSLWLSAAKAG